MTFLSCSPSSAMFGNFGILGNFFSFNPHSRSLTLGNLSNTAGAWPWTMRIANTSYTGAAEVGVFGAVCAIPAQPTRKSGSRNRFCYHSGPFYGIIRRIEKVQGNRAHE